jgi:hypothetical protein
MRLTPKDIHREVLKRSERVHGSEPTWYAIWYGVPHADESEMLGKTERLARPRWWRAYPVTGDFPKDIRGWVNVIEWFIKLKEVSDGPQ